MPRLPALFRAKRRWRLPEQIDPLEYLEEHPSCESIWRRNYMTLAPQEGQVLEVLLDQASRQIIVLPELEAKKRYPSLVIASLGANRKEKQDRSTARVLFDGTNRLEVNERTRVRDEERAPIAADLKRSMRARAARGEATFAVTADVSEAHRQVPIHPQDWRLSGCRVRPGGDVFINTVGHLAWLGRRTTGPGSPQLLDDTQYMAGTSASACGGRLLVGVQRQREPFRDHVFLHSFVCIGCASLVA